MYKDDRYPLPKTDCYEKAYDLLDKDTMDENDDDEAYINWWRLDLRSCDFTDDGFDINYYLLRYATQQKWYRVIDLFVSRKHKFILGEMENYFGFEQLIKILWEHKDDVKMNRKQLDIDDDEDEWKYIENIYNKVKE